MADEKTILERLAEPFHPEDIEWRVQQAGIGAGGSPWAMVIPYITNRAIQQRLDDVVGLNWQNVQKPTPDGKGYICGISIFNNNEWITRYDGAEYTNIEPLKGALSGSMKRAGAQFGIGRYLYNLDEQFAECRTVQSRRDCADGENFQKVKQRNKSDVFIAWKTPRLPSWAVPVPDTKVIVDKFAECESMMALEAHFKYAVQYAKTHQDKILYDLAIEQKDIMKAKIDEQLTLNMKKNYADIDAWLDSQIQAIELVTNKEAVIGASKTMKVELLKKCQYQKFDTKPLQIKFDEAIKAKMEKLENNHA